MKRTQTSRISGGSLDERAHLTAELPPVPEWVRNELPSLDSITLEDRYEVTIAALEQFAGFPGASLVSDLDELVGERLCNAEDRGRRIERRLREVYG